MEIDEQVEDHVRTALGAAIDRDGDALLTAFQGLTPAQIGHAHVLALFVAGYVVNEIHDGSPSEADLDSLAQQIFKSESGWSPFDAQQIRQLLSAASKGDPVIPGVDLEDVLILAIVCDSYLLGGFRNDEEAWYTYLDEIWNQFLATPAPQ